MTSALVVLAMSAQIIAHRGASFEAPENTLPAVELAWEQGADAVEVDVFLTKDGHVVAIHDEDTKRVAGVAKKVEDQTLAELQALDVGAWKDEKFAGTRIPTLDQVLAAVPEGKGLVVEIKDDDSILPELERALDRSGKRDQVSLISFGYGVMREAKRRMSDLPCYWLYGFSVGERVRYGNPGPDRLVALAKAAGLDGLDVNYTGAFGADLPMKLAAEGMKLLVYTVNDPESARRLESNGIAGLTTDRPAFLRKALQDVD